jgi:hypothetical protein
LIENDEVKFNLDYHKAPRSRVAPERIQKSATIQTEEIPTIDSSVSNSNVSFKNIFRYLEGETNNKMQSWMSSNICYHSCDIYLDYLNTTSRFFNQFIS